MTQRRAKVLMVQGTASDVGKSTLVTALCRIFIQDGLRVAPFKAQNMSLNAAVTPSGHEIGRAQYAQAEAARTEPTADMNPILLKPTDDRRSQIIVMGRAIAVEEARAYYERRSDLWPVVTASLDRLRETNDLVIIEGAGSPAEINLRARDIVNMRVARYARAPVILVGDIERGGVFASVFGTVSLLESDERALVRAFVINKFRGDESLLTNGLETLASLTGVPCLGVLPWIADTGVADEDSAGLERHREPHIAADLLDIAVVRYPHIANFDDFDPLRRHPGVAVRYVQHIEELGRPHLIILPGSKTTVADLAWMRSNGLAEAVIAARKSGVPLVGVCGGYQMLGNRILDPEAVESTEPVTPGLGLLPVETKFAAQKRTVQVSAIVTGVAGLLAGAVGTNLRAYEIHMGRTSGPRDLASAFSIGPNATSDGHIDADGLTLGCYLHGMFADDALRNSILRAAANAAKRTPPPHWSAVTNDAAYDRLAELVRSRLHMPLIYGMMNESVAVT